MLLRDAEYLGYGKTLCRLFASLSPLLTLSWSAEVNTWSTGAAGDHRLHAVSYVKKSLPDQCIARFNGVPSSLHYACRVGLKDRGSSWARSFL